MLCDISLICNLYLKVVAHIVFVHLSVGKYSVLFAQKLRRNNYVTPKNYLDFITRLSAVFNMLSDYCSIIFLILYVSKTCIIYLNFLEICLFSFIKYVCLVSSYNNLLEKKDHEILKMCERLDGGLLKLSEASEQLNELNKKLAVQKVTIAII